MLNRGNALIKFADFCLAFCGGFCAPYSVYTRILRVQSEFFDVPLNGKMQVSRRLLAIADYFYLEKTIKQFCVLGLTLRSACNESGVRLRTGA